jgi:hypothetical protein
MVDVVLENEDMKSVKNLVSMLSIILVLAACGSSDSPVLSTLPQTGPVFPNSPWGNYNGAGCLPGTILQNYQQPITFVWPQDEQYFPFVSICPNAQLTLKADSDEDLHIRNNYGQDELFTRAELAAGKTVTFIQGGPLTMYCTDCGDLDVYWHYVTVAY